jgi:hypothetical protein
MPFHVISRLTWVLLAGLYSISGRADQGQAESANSPNNTPRACSCADGRQFSVGASLFGKNSSRVVVTGFRTDPTQSVGPAQLPPCSDLTVVGQVIGLKTANDRPFLQRENLKRGTIPDICRTKIQFSELKKAYDFFADDGSAVTLSDVDTGQPPGSPDGDASIGDDQVNDLSPDLTGKDLIQLIGRQPRGDDPSASSFDAEDLKEGAYCIVRRQLKAPPVVDQLNNEVAHAGAVSSQSDPVTVWAGTLGRIEKRTGYRAEPFWVVELLPHSAPLSFSRSLGSLVQVLHRKHSSARKVALSSDDIVEVNHFFDQYGVEWTRFGVATDDAQARESAGTTVLPSIYGPPGLTLDQNLRNAQKARVFEAVQAAALQLELLPKAQMNSKRGEPLVLEEGTGFEPQRLKTPHLLRKQCLFETFQMGVPDYPSGTKASSLLRIGDVDIRVFQPRDSPQVPDDYYAIDLKLQLRSVSGNTNIPVVCRFPFAPIDMNLLVEAQHILSSEFAIQRREAR